MGCKAVKRNKIKSLEFAQSLKWPLKYSTFREHDEVEGMMTVFLSKYSSRRFTRERENQCFHDDEVFFMERIDCNGWAQTNPQGGGLQKEHNIHL